MFKEQFPLLTNTTYLNTAYVGLMSIPLADFRRSHEEAYLLNGGDHYKIQAYKDLDKMHQNFALFFGSTADRCFGISNFSSGIRVALSLLPKRMNVLLIEEDYPSLSNAFKEFDFNVETIPMGPNLEELIEEKLKSTSVAILALSIVQYTTGLLIDQDFLKRMKIEYPNLLIVGDGTQFLGAHQFHFDRSPFDVVAASGYKWLLAGFGNGIVLFSKAFKERTAQNTVQISDRFFQGHFNILGMASLNFAIHQFIKNDFQALVEFKSKLSQKAKMQLNELGFLPSWVLERTNHSSIFNIDGGENLFHFLLKKKIRVVQRGAGIRISFHFYNTEEDLNSLVKALKEFK